MLSWCMYVCVHSVCMQFTDGAFGVAQGVLRGMGKQTACLWYNIIGFWVFGVAISYALAFPVRAFEHTHCMLLCSLLCVDWWRCVGLCAYSRSLALRVTLRACIACCVAGQTRVWVYLLACRSVSMWWCPVRVVANVLQAKLGLAGLWIGLTTGDGAACVLSLIALARCNWRTAAEEAYTKMQEAGG